MATHRARRLAGIRVGLVSDTHGLLRPEAVDALRGSDLILHAGDIGDAAILDALAALAPVTAVRGNNDRGEWAERLREWQTVTVGAVTIGLVHDRNDFARLAAGRVAAIVSGHSTARPSKSATASCSSTPAARARGVSACQYPSAKSSSRAASFTRG